MSKLEGSEVWLLSIDQKQKSLELFHDLGELLDEAPVVACLHDLLKLIDADLGAELQQLLVDQRGMEHELFVVFAAQLELLQKHFKGFHQRDLVHRVVLCNQVAE